MKSFLFESMYLLSSHEKKGRQVSFHPKKNLIVGRNHTGKSTLVKSLFRALGAKPTGELRSWPETVQTLVRVSINGESYQVLHRQGYRALFDARGQLLATCSGHKEWSKVFAEVCGFNLVLTDKEGVTVLADPKCFFLPFYINQDGSWQSHWATFSGLQQYKSPLTAILEYFSGIKPPEYYSIHSSRSLLKSKLDELQREWNVLERARDRISSSVALVGLKLNPDNFEHEIDRLTATVTDLNRQQEVLRDLTVRDQELVESIQTQIRLADEALAIYDKDASFLRSETREPLSCPTCGAEHQESFLDHLTYAEDARVLRELSLRLRQDEMTARQKFEASRAKLDALRVEYQAVANVLDVRRGDIRFGDVVSSMGAEAAFESFETEQSALAEEIKELRHQIAGLDDKLGKLTNGVRSKAIIAAFREAYRSALYKLNLPSMDMARIRLNSRPDISGSAGPRAVLAYYAALWKTTQGPHGSFLLPLVIDSPNQQGQDDINLPKVLSYLAEELPSESQVIVSTEMDTPQAFDKRILLDEPYQLLNADDYESVLEQIEPLSDAMRNAIDADK